MNYWQQGILNFQHRALLLALFVIKSTVTCAHSLLCFIRKLEGLPCQENNSLFLEGEAAPEIV